MELKVTIICGRINDVLDLRYGPPSSTTPINEHVQQAEGLFYYKFNSHFLTL